MAPLRALIFATDYPLAVVTAISHFFRESLSLFFQEDLRGGDSFEGIPNKGLLGYDA